MNDTYDSLDWIHPDLKSYSYQYHPLDPNGAGEEHQESLSVYYTDLDSPELLRFAITTSGTYDAPEVDGYYLAWPVEENRLSMLHYFIAGTDFCYLMKNNKLVYRHFMHKVEDEAEWQHFVFCLKWDWTHGKKDPTEYLFNEDEAIRDIAIEFINSKEN